jgi:hypothetical protein
MKKGFILMIGLFLMTNVIGKDYKFNASYYGVSLYQSLTGSGYGSNYYMSLNIQKNQRLFELGCLFSYKSQRFMGFEFMYKHFTGYRKANFYNKPVKTYFHYNFLFRSPEEIIVNKNAPAANSFDPNMSGGKMTTYEHSIGFGLQIRVFPQMVIDGNLGMGVYLGSKYQGMHPDTWGIHKDNYGIIPSFKLGLGYTF